MAMNIQVPKNIGNFLSSSQLAASPDGLSSMNLAPAPSNLLHIRHNHKALIYCLFPFFVINEIFIYRQFSTYINEVYRKC
jgi:hypothetical protein